MNTSIIIHLNEFGILSGIVDMEGYFVVSLL
jgi:hypothetical protein